jgi:hypothetical protein
MPKYYHELTLEEMFEHHDHTYQMSDDNRAYENGRKQREILEDKVKSIGGWTEELVDLYNKYAPGSGEDNMFKKDWKWMQEINK